MTYPVTLKLCANLVSRSVMVLVADLGLLPTHISIDHQLPAPNANFRDDLDYLYRISICVLKRSNFLLNKMVTWVVHPCLIVVFVHHLSGVFL